jgi:isocitrate dehydrogenase (NAD+)
MSVTSAPDIAGKKIANPSALMLAAALMLGYLGMEDRAARIRNAIRAVVQDGHCRTPDLGGSCSTDQFADAVLQRL